MTLTDLATDADGSIAWRFLRHIARTTPAEPLLSSDPSYVAVLSGEVAPIDRFEADGRTYLVVARRRSPKVSLSDRERQAAKLAAEGLANKLIACELGVTAATVANHLSRAATKLGVDSRVALIRAMRAQAA